MKKTTVIAALFAACSVVYAGEKPVIEQPAITPPVATPSSYALEIAGAHNWAADHLFGDKLRVNTVGIDLTGIYNLDENNSVNLRFGFASGHDHIGLTVDEAATSLAMRFDMNTFYLMPGYRYTLPVDDSLKVFAGVNAGIINHSLKNRNAFNFGTLPMVEKMHDSAFGFAASVEVGAIYDLCDQVYIFAAYQFSGSTAQPKLDDIAIHEQYYHSVRAGVGIKF